MEKAHRSCRKELAVKILHTSVSEPRGKTGICGLQNQETTCYLGLTTEYRATFEGPCLSSAWLVGSSVDSKVYNLDGWSARQLIPRSLSSGSSARQSISRYIIIVLKYMRFQKRL